MGEAGTWRVFMDKELQKKKPEQNSISFEEKTHSSRFSVPAKAPSPQYSRLSEKTMDLRFLHSEKAFLPISNIWIPSAEEGMTAYLRDKGFVTPIILP